MVQNLSSGIEGEFRVVYYETIIVDSSFVPLPVT
jgi:hypothetical protein